MNEYEQSRLKRIQENKAKMEALGLANSFMGSCRSSTTNGGDAKRDLKGKKKVSEDDDDEDYKPTNEQDGEEDDDDEELCDGDDYDHDEDDDYGSRKRKKSKGKKSTPNKKVTARKLSWKSDYVDDDADLMKAIALSLQGSAGCSSAPNSMPSEGFDVHQENPVKRKKKSSPFKSRVPMTEDELIIHFFQFDEAGKGSITVRDLRRVATAHDFVWNEKEMEHMISLFDSDGDGKLSLEDFIKIVERCNMRRGPEEAAVGS